MREAAFGDSAEARRAAEAGWELYPESQGVAVETARAYAMAGESAKAESLASRIEKLYPLDTQTQSLWLPAIQAQLELNRHNGRGAGRLTARAARSNTARSHSSPTSRLAAAAARVRALTAYKDFLALWKDADPQIPIYRQAKTEYAKLR